MWAIVATAIGVGGATAIGAIIGFFVGNIPDKGRDTIMGFAAGMMLAAASVGLKMCIRDRFATYARNTKYSNNVVYVGPMGCRTGFYFLLRDTVSQEEALQIVRQAVSYTHLAETEVSASTRRIRP